MKFRVFWKAARKLPGSFQVTLRMPSASRSVLSDTSRSKKRFGNFEKLDIFGEHDWEHQKKSKHSKVKFCGGSIASHHTGDQGREGSTSSSRGKHGWRFTARIQVCEFVWVRSNFPLRTIAKAIQKCLRCSQSIPWAKVLMTERFSFDRQKCFFLLKSKFFCQNLSEASRKLPGSSSSVFEHPRVQEIHFEVEMTRRAFTALRVIRYYGKSCINWAWENLGILIRKMITAQNL